jgi:hypothetical protein
MTTTVLRTPHEVLKFCRNAEAGAFMEVDVEGFGHVAQILEPCPPDWETRGWKVMAEIDPPLRTTEVLAVLAKAVRASEIALGGKT